MKKIIFVCVVFLLVLYSYQQNNSSNASGKAQGNWLDQKMLDIHKQVKTYAYSPLYQVEFSKDAYGYEILINDVPLQRSLIFGNVNEQRIPINDHIMASGKQDITIRLFPPQLSDGSRSPTLVDTSKFTLKVIRQKLDSPMEEYQQLFYFSSPPRPAENFLASGQDFLEFKGSFDAEVPYHLEGWQNSKDLSKEDPEKLLKQAVSAYSGFRDLLIRRDSDAYANLMYDKEVELAKAFYWVSPADSKERWDEMKATVLEKREYLPLKEFKMVLYGEGKVLALQPTSAMYRDYLSAIHAQTENDDIMVSFFLHKKSGSDELTPIR